MTEERKHAILFAATLLTARKIIDALDSSKPNPGKDFFIDKAIKEAAAILEKIDQPLCLEHRMLHQLWTQRICHQSRTQRDRQGSDGSFVPV